MAIFDVLMPHGRAARIVKADGEIATLMVTHTPPGTGYDIQTWETHLPGEPQQVIILFAARS